MEFNFFRIVYCVFIKKIYHRRVKGRNAAFNNLVLILIMINLVSICLLLEWLLPIKGFIYLSHAKILPMALIGMLVFGIVYGIYYFISPPLKYNSKKIELIRTAFKKTINYTRYQALAYLILSLIIFIMSLILVFPEYS